MNIEEAKKIAKALNNLVEKENACAEMSKALPLFIFSVVDSDVTVKENLALLHLPVSLRHPEHGEKVAYATREAHNDIRNGWEIVQENAFQGMPEEEPVISSEDLVVTPEVSEDKDDLIAMAKALNIDVDRRWSVKRLQDAIYGEDA